jgi:transcriptional regulator GlxA family with amidase domain
MPKSFANLVKVGRAKAGVETRTIAFVAYPGLTPLDLIAPMTTFLGLTRGLVGTSRHYRTVVVAERPEPIGSDTPMAVVPDDAFEEVPAPFALIVPGGGMAALEAMGNERLINYLRFAEHGPRSSARYQRVLSSWQRPAYSRVGRRPPTRPTQSHCGS